MSETVANKETPSRITDEAIAKLRAKIGIPFNMPRPPHNREVTWDGARHFAQGYGDDNPLYCEPDYARKTRWANLIAAPAFIYTIGDYDATPTDAEKQIVKGDPLAGTGSYQAVMDFEWWRPLKQGDTVKLRSAYIAVKVNENSKFAGRTVSEVQAFFYRNQNDEPVAIRRGTWVRADRQASAEKKKVYELPKPYRKEELEKIDAAYDAETIRGADTLYWEDVAIGDDLPTIVRGPLRTSDLVILHIGWGMQLTPPGNFKISYKLRKKAPGLFTPNSLGVPDTVQRLHWEKEWANELGIPISYDYGGLRELFLTNIITNWMGDDGWLWKLSCQHRKFVYTGDTYWMKGRITDKREVDDRNEVHLEVWVENQWGTVVSPGTAVVLLPTRTQAVELPKPPAENIDELIAWEVRRQAKEEASHPEDEQQAQSE